MTREEFKKKVRKLIELSGYTGYFSPIGSSTVFPDGTIIRPAFGYFVKPKEQKPTITIDQLKSFMLQYLQDVANKKDDSEIDADTDKWAKKILEYSLEQKPANNIKPKFKVCDRVNKNDREDEEYCILTITSVNIDEHCYVCNQCSVIDFEEQDLWHIVEQKPAEWSEEDERMIQSVIWHLRNSVNNGDTKHTAGQLENWLKALRSHWKPSEEQIIAVEAAYSVLKSHDTWGEDEHLPILMSLINDLQKLL